MIAITGVVPGAFPGTTVQRLQIEVSDTGTRPNYLYPGNPGGRIQAYDAGAHILVVTRSDGAPYWVFA